MIESPAGWAAVEAIESGRPVREVLMDQGERLVGQLREQGRLLPPPAPMDPAVYQRDWGKLEVPAAEAHPAPLVPYRDATEAEIPSAARKVRALMEASGWRVRATYALGWAIDSTGKTKALTHSLALRAERGGSMGRDGQRLVACWTVKEPCEGLLKLKVRGVTEVPPPATGWKFDLAYGWSRVSPQHKLSAAALKAEIQEVLEHG